MFKCAYCLQLPFPLFGLASAVFVRFSQSHTRCCHRSILDPVVDLLFAWGLELVSFSLSIGTSSSSFYVPLQLPETNTTPVTFLRIPLTPRSSQVDGGLVTWKREGPRSLAGGDVFCNSYSSIYLN